MNMVPHQSVQWCLYQNGCACLLLSGINIVGTFIQSAITVLLSVLSCNAIQLQKELRYYCQQGMILDPVGFDRNH